MFPAIKLARFPLPAQWLTLNLNYNTSLSSNIKIMCMNLLLTVFIINFAL